MNSPSRAPASTPRPRAGFTLIELAMVIAIIVILTALLVPAFTGIKSAGDTTSAAYTIKAVLDQARTYAMANNTYTWVGFYEEDGSQPSTSPTPAAGTGRLVISTVASSNGTTVYDPTTSANIDPTKLMQLNKLTKIDNIHLALLTVGTGGATDTFDARPALQNDPVAGYNDSRFGELNSTPTAPTTNSLFPFQYPLAGSAQYTFRKTLQFNPRGEGRINSTYDVRRVIEIGIAPTRGNTAIIGSTNLTALQLSGFSGDVKIYRK